MHIKRAPYAGFTLDALTYQFRVRIVGKFDLVFFAMVHNCDWFQLFSGILIFLLHSLFIHFCSGLCNVFTHHVQKALLKLFWTVINAYVAPSKYWRPIVTHTWLVLDTQGIRHDTSQNDQFALAVVLIRESSHRKTHFPRRYPDTFLFSPGDVNRLSVHLASVKKKKKKRLSETEKASASDPECKEGGYVVKFLLILDIRWGEVAFRNKHFPLPWPSSPNRYARQTKWEGTFQGDDRIYSWPVTCNLRIAVLAVTNLSCDCTQQQQFYL